MWNKNKCLKEKLQQLDDRVWKLENPPKYKKGQKTKYGICQEAECVVRWEKHYELIIPYRRWKYTFLDKGEHLVLS